jgi:streptomycin 6-kinase
VTLVDATPDALLLARARPGTPWPWSAPGSLDDLVGVAADLLTRLWAAPSAPYPFPALEDVYPQDERVAREDAAWEQRRRGEPERGTPGLQRLPLAAEVAGQPLATCAEERLLHGDFITKNLVRETSARIGWVALDPLPMTGDPAAEVAAFAAYHPAELILPIAEALGPGPRGRLTSSTALGGHLDSSPGRTSMARRPATAGAPRRFSATQRSAHHL